MDGRRSAIKKKRNNLLLNSADLSLLKKKNKKRGKGRKNDTLAATSDVMVYESSSDDNNLIDILHHNEHDLSSVDAFDDQLLDDFEAMANTAIKSKRSTRRRSKSAQIPTNHASNNPATDDFRSTSLDPNIHLRTDSVSGANLPVLTSSPISTIGILNISTANNTSVFIPTPNTSVTSVHSSRTTALFNVLTGQEIQNASRTKNESVISTRESNVVSSTSSLPNPITQSITALNSTSTNPVTAKLSDFMYYDSSSDTNSLIDILGTDEPASGNTPACNQDSSSVDAFDDKIMDDFEAMANITDTPKRTRRRRSKSVQMDDNDDDNNNDYDDYRSKSIDPNIRMRTESSSNANLTVATSSTISNNVLITAGSVTSSSGNNNNTASPSFSNSNIHNTASHSSSSSNNNNVSSTIQVDSPSSHDRINNNLPAINELIAVIVPNQQALRCLHPMRNLSKLNQHYLTLFLTDKVQLLNFNHLTDAQSHAIGLLFSFISIIMFSPSNYKYKTNQRILEIDHNLLNWSNSRFDLLIIHLNQLLSNFKTRNRRSARVKNFSNKKFHDHRIREEFQCGNYSKAMSQIKSFPVIIHSQENLNAVARELNLISPPPVASFFLTALPKVQSNNNTTNNTTPLFVDINPIKAIKSISRSKRNTSPGINGQSGDIFRSFFINKANQTSPNPAADHLINILASTATNLLNNRINAILLDYLYAKKIILLPKDAINNNNFRIIQINNSELVLLHRIIANQECIIDLKANNFSTIQMGFNNNGMYQINEIINNFFSNNLIKEQTVFLSLDLVKAFDTVSHDALLSSIQVNCPNLFPFINNVLLHSRYLFIRNDDNGLFFNFYKNGDVGLPQGDPLSTFLFSLAINSIIEPICSCAFYDDLFLHGKIDNVLKKFKQLTDELLKINLNFNVSKSTLFINVDNPDLFLSNYNTSFNIINLNDSNADVGKILLGQPVGTRSYINRILSCKIDEIETDFEAVQRILINDPQRFSCAIRICFLTKFACLRCITPSSDYNPLAKRIDAIIRRTLEVALNSDNVSPEQLTIFSLPFALGGMGFINIFRNHETIFLGNHIQNLSAGIKARLARFYNDSLQIGRIATSISSSSSSSNVAVVYTNQIIQNIFHKTVSVCSDSFYNTTFCLKKDPATFVPNNNLPFEFTSLICNSRPKWIKHLIISTSEVIKNRFLDSVTNRDHYQCVLNTNINSSLLHSCIPITDYSSLTAKEYELDLCRRLGSTGKYNLVPDPSTICKCTAQYVYPIASIGFCRCNHNRTTLHDALVRAMIGSIKQAGIFSEPVPGNLNLFPAMNDNARPDIRIIDSNARERFLDIVTIDPFAPSNVHTFSNSNGNVMAPLKAKEAMKLQKYRQHAISNNTDIIGISLTTNGTLGPNFEKELKKWADVAFNQRNLDSAMFTLSTRFKIAITLARISYITYARSALGNYYANKINAATTNNLDLPNNEMLGLFPEVLDINI